MKALILALPSILEKGVRSAGNWGRTSVLEVRSDFFDQYRCVYRDGGKEQAASNQGRKEGCV